MALEFLFTIDPIEQIKFLSILCTNNSLKSEVALMKTPKLNKIYDVERKRKKIKLTKDFQQPHL